MPTPFPFTHPLPSPARNARLASTLAGLTLLVAACAGIPPPTDLMAVTAVRVADAAAAGGNEAAPAEMRSARDKLERAKVAMSDKNHDLARTLAQSAQVDAQLAEVKARANQADKAANTVREDSRVLQQELGRKSP